MATLKTAKFRVASLFALAISAIAVAGCGSASSSNSSTAAAAGPAPSSSTAATSTSSSSESKPEAIGTAKGSAGTYLTADEGRTVYLWVADSGGKSACSGACAKAWPPVETGGKPKADDGVNAADLGTIRRSDGSEQVTYNGHPLYHFIGDKSKGETNGQGNNAFGALWWLVAPSGKAITTGSSGSTGRSYGSSTSSSTSSSGGGGGWG
jgi:predicted lipoprotein with Yx(FWY)xxD motif